MLSAGVALHVVTPVTIEPTWPARALGGVLVVMAVALASWAQRVMCAAGTNIHPWKPTLALVTTGPFAHTRNPMYSALVLVHAGIGLLIGGVWPVAMAPVLLVALSLLVVAREERYLEGLMGESYRDYCRAAPRWGWRSIACFQTGVTQCRKRRQ